jgi:hypothetical protein
MCQYPHLPLILHDCEKTFKRAKTRIATNTHNQKQTKRTHQTSQAIHLNPITINIISNASQARDTPSLN